MKLGAWPLALLPLMVVAFLLRLAGSAERDDAYVLVRRAPVRADREPTVLSYPAAGDPGRARVERLMAGGFPAELLRTFAMTRRFVQRTAPPSSVAYARAAAPLYVALGADDTFHGAPYRDRVIGHAPFTAEILADVPVIWVDEAALPARPPAAADAAALQAIVAGFGTAIVSLVAPGPTRWDAEARRWSYPLRDGYIAFLQVVAAEWRGQPGEDGGGGDPRDYLRRAEMFASVRANARSPWGAPPQDTDPEVIATVLYRLAASELGRRIAPDDAYLPFLAEAPPRGIPAALLLGAFRNFQAKLLSAWAAADRAGRKPADLAGLIEAYATAHPAERAEVARIYLVTTWGAPGDRW